VKRLRKWVIVEDERIVEGLLSGNVTTYDDVDSAFCQIRSLDQFVARVELRVVGKRRLRPKR
jgi:hypothetical protein